LIIAIVLCCKDC